MHVKIAHDANHFLLMSLHLQLQETTTIKISVLLKSMNSN